MGKQLKGIIAIIVFLLISLSPFIYNNIMKGYSKKPAHLQKAESVTGKAECIVGDFVGNMEKDEKGNYIHMEDVTKIRAIHGDKLSHAGIIPGKESSVRDQFVREMNRKSKGLSGCIQCHHNRAEFCDKCHNYPGVFNVNKHTGCFACHYYPTNDEEFKKWNEAWKKEEALE